MSREPRDLRHPDYAYTRREMLVIFGGFLMVLAGVPGRSETYFQTAQSLTRHLIQFLLVFLGLMSPAASPTPVAAKPHIPAAPISKPAVKPAANSMQFRTIPLFRHYNYIFEGKATYHGKACPNASVLVRLTSSEKTVTKGSVTEPDGNYSLMIGIDAEEKASVDWTIEAYTPDFNRVELSGRQIVQSKSTEVDDKAPITVNNPVDFVLSSAK